MLKKSYYKLTEIEKKFDLTFEDIQFLVESNRLQLAVFVSNTSYLIGFYDNGKYTGIGTVDYEGLIGLTREVSLKVLKGQTTKTSHFSLLEPDKCNNWNGEYRFEKPWPNESIDKWVARNPNTLKWKYIPARTLPATTINSQKKFLESLGQLSQAASPNDQSLRKHLSQIEEMPTKQLIHTPIQVMLKDICIQHSSIADVIQTVNMRDPTTKVGFPNLFHQLVKDSIESNPELSAANLWRYIVEQHNQDNDDFDRNSIIREASDRAVIWEDSNGKEREMKKRSFYQVYNKLK